MTLVSFWFIVLVVFWTGFLVLEGFDFGVGMLHGLVGRDEQGRRVALGAIGPLWDGNEVWLIVAAAGMFAAFPGWYATMFSGFYLVFVLLLVALIARGVSFEFRDRRDSRRWRRTWAAATTGGSLLAPLLIGVALGNLLHGVPIGTDQEYAGIVGRPAQPLLVVHRGHGGAALPAPRGQLPGAQDGRRGPPAVAARRPPDRPAGRGRRARVRGLDPGHGRQRGRAAAGRGGRRRRGRGRRLAPRPRPGRARLRGHVGRDGRRGRVDLRQPLPEGDGLHARPVGRPDGRATPRRRRTR